MGALAYSAIHLKGIAVGNDMNAVNAEAVTGAHNGGGVLRVVTLFNHHAQAPVRLANTWRKRSRRFSVSKCSAGCSGIGAG